MSLGKNLLLTLPQIMLLQNVKDIDFKVNPICIFLRLWIFLISGKPGFMGRVDLKSKENLILKSYLSVLDGPIWICGRLGTLSLGAKQHLYILIFGTEFETVLIHGYRLELDIMMASGNRLHLPSAEI